MNPPRYHIIPTEQVRGKLEDFGRDIEEERAAIHILSGQLEAARKRLEAAQAARRHAAAVLAWRERTGKEQGDPVCDLLNLMSRADNKVHRMTRIEQIPADDDSPAKVVIRLRNPEGQQIEVIYHGVIVKLSDGHPADATIPLGRSFYSRMNHAVVGFSWSGLGSDHNWLVQPSKAKPCSNIEISGELISVENVEK